MRTNIFRYRFEASVPTGAIATCLILAIWGCQALHGEVQTRLEVAFFYDPLRRAWEIETQGPVSRAFNCLFLGFLTRLVGQSGFVLEQLVAEIPVDEEAAA